MCRSLIMLGKCIGIVVCVSLSHASANDIETTALARRDAIQEELSKPGNRPWTGEYNYSYRPWGSGNRMLISSQAGVYREYTCGCTSTKSHSSGTVSLTPGDIQIDWTVGKNSLPRSEILVPVWWGTKDYLVLQSEVLSFCVAARRGEELPDAWVKPMGLKRKPLTTPLLPKSYGQYEQMEHIQGKVTGLMKNDWIRESMRSQRRVRIGIGTDDGLLPEMKVYPADKKIKKIAKIRIYRLGRVDSFALVTSEDLSAFDQFHMDSAVTTDPE
ncbi:hypothetical protein SH528x_002925 [Novipirellula sp. SH528]|uniref:hypothetical protein n=1 Tax=Novipirellula sp. SH528 TaxID=3454466 RepID=UPI003F9F9C29